METGEILAALACLLAAALLGLPAALVHRRTGAPPAPPRLAPAPQPTYAAAPTAVSNAWQSGQQYEPMGDNLKSFLANRDAVRTAAALPGKTEVHRESPARAADFVADVLVPLCWSLISALFVGGFFGVVAACIPPIAAYWPAFFGASAFLAAGYVWLERMKDHSRLLWQTEEMIHEDLDHDGTVGKPPQSYSVHIDYTDKEGNIDLDDRLPEPYSGALHEFARAITLGTATFSEGGAGKYDYPREMWRRQKEGKPAGLVDIFMERGWARDRGGKRGIGLTTDGENVITGLANQVPPSQ